MPGNRPNSGRPLLTRGAAALGILLAGAAVVCLWQTPNQAEAAMLTAKDAGVFKDKDKLLITLNVTNPDTKELRGTLKIELIDAKGKSVGKAEQEISQKEAAAYYRFQLPLTGLPADQVTLRCHLDGKVQFASKVSELLFAKAHETSLSSGQEFTSGSNASLRLAVRGVKSMTESIPLGGAEVSISLKGAEKISAILHPLYKGKTGADGSVTAEFKVPAVPAGNYKLAVATKSAFGEETLERDVRVKNEGKVLLVTDKPLYQPGQLIHIRALALRPFDLAPMSKQALTFEVEDGKGNKVFKRSQMTSEFGVAAVDFQLADEVNMGNYHVRAQLGETTSDKTVSVQRYVLPKFKADVKADKAYYLPKETLKVDLQSDYFFGKPVAGGKVKVTASTFDVAFKDFQTWEGKTDAEGHASFEIKLPDYFVGQPLAKGDAIVKLETKITDTADHTETITKTYPVSNSPVRVSLIPEGGRVVPGLDNRIFVAAVHPDGSPAVCDVKLWIHTPQAEPLPRLWGENKDQIDVAALLGVTATAVIGGDNKDKPDKKPAETVIAKLTTNESGLAEFIVNPKPAQFRKAEWQQQNIELLGGQQHPWWGQKSYLDIGMEVNDKKGPAISFVTAINADPFGENVVLRLDKAIYKGGDTAQIDIRTSAGLPTVYLDVVKGGQTLLTKWLDVKSGKAAHKLDLPQTVFGTVEIHAYQMLAGGEILRDTRVVYVQPSADLKIDVRADKSEYLPGNEGKIRFTVTDAAGKPTAAALGVIIVDEAVYALQEMQPGLEKVYFTLQEELLKPQAQAVYKPSEPIPVLIQQPELPVAKQQIAQALLAAVTPKATPRWEVDPAVERRRKMEGQVQQLGWAITNYAMQHDALDIDPKTKSAAFKADLLKQLDKSKMIAPESLKDPFGKPVTPDSLAKLDKNFTPDRLARSITCNRLQTIAQIVLNYSVNDKGKWFKNGKWNYPDTALADAIKSQKQDAKWLKDAWGREMKIVKRDSKWENNPYGGRSEFAFHEIVSAGPDGKFGSDDDVKLSECWNANVFDWWHDAGDPQALLFGMAQGLGERRMMLGMERGALLRDGAMPAPRAPAGPGGGGGGFGNAPGPARPTAAIPKELPAKMEAKNGHGGEDKSKSTGSAQPTRLREFFPETMLWNPSLITDDQGRAELPVQFADSITTWRLSASASSKYGALGGVTAPLRVFQDFFVDLDLPIALTQNDEVAFPVAVYNYLKTPQTVKLDLKQEPWFELVDDKGLSRSLDLKPNEVTSIKYRIRAKKIGNHPLTVSATGSKMSDAIKRVIEIVPDGTKIEVVASDRLAGNVSKTIMIPADSVADASKILVKIYPGVFSQVLEGTEGMLRLPGG